MVSSTSEYNLFRLYNFACLCCKSWRRAQEGECTFIRIDNLYSCALQAEEEKETRRWEREWWSIGRSLASSYSTRNGQEEEDGAVADVVSVVEYHIATLL